MTKYDIIDKLNDEKPCFHVNGTSDQGIPIDVQKWIADNSQPDWITAETGSGDNSIVLAASAKRHYSIAPTTEERDQIARWLECSPDIMNRLIFIPQCSQTVKPSDIGGEVNLFLIDGDHGFPTVYLDYYLADQLLKIGGYLLVDDSIIIRTVAILIEYLDSETRIWRNCGIYGGRTRIYQKIQPNLIKNWNLQPFNGRPEAFA